MENNVRLQELLLAIKERYCGGKAAELARRIGRSDSYVNRLFYPPGKNGAKGIGPEIMDACKKAFALPLGFWDMTVDQATAAWDFAGKPIAALSDDDAVPDGVVLIKESRVRFSGGNGHIVPHYEEIEESAPATYRRAWLIQEGMNPAKVRRFQVKGDSMAPLLFSGDTMLVNMAETDIRDGYVYALRYGDDLRVKRCYRKLDGGLILHSDNPEHRPRDEEIPASAVEHSVGIIGRVREKSGKGGL